MISGSIISAYNLISESIIKRYNLNIVSMDVLSMMTSVAVVSNIVISGSFITKITDFVTVNKKSNKKVSVISSTN